MLANLGALPPGAIEVVERSLKGQTLLPADKAFQILRSEPRGHVVVVLGTMKKLGTAGLLSSRDHKERRLSLAKE